MSQVALTGRDTLIFAGNLFTDFADGDVATLTFENDAAEFVNGKNDNAIYALNAKGKQGTLTIKLLRGSNDDVFMNTQFLSMLRDFPSYVLGNGNFTKRIGDGTGAVIADSYLATGGVISRQPDANSSSDGKTDDAVVTWKVKFPKIVRVM